MKRYFGIGAIVFLVIGLAIGGFVYWQSLKSTPQYSLALLVDAARRDDQAEVAELVDSDAMVDDLLPQVIEKAAEIYGRGQPKTVIQKATVAATPLLPAVKEKARAELPGLIRRETSRFGNVWFPLMVLGANRYLDIRFEGETAFVNSKKSEEATEVKMVRNGGKWKIVGVRDERLASEIARRVGQEIIALTMSGNKNGLGVKSIDALIDQLQQATQ
ncbi:MAG: hypothetical protein ACJ72Z_05585 [Pyrinomonadaceae bacterium]